MTYEEEYDGPPAHWRPWRERIGRSDDPAIFDNMTDAEVEAFYEEQEKEMPSDRGKGKCE